MEFYSWRLLFDGLERILQIEKKYSYLRSCEFLKIKTLPRAQRNLPIFWNLPPKQKRVAFQKLQKSAKSLHHSGKSSVVSAAHPDM